MTYAPKPDACLGCPAYEKGHSFVPPSGPTTARVALVGQGPGREEAEGHWDVPTQQSIRRPFIGRSGYKLDQWLQRANTVHPELPPLRRDECAVGNIVWCWLTTGNKDRAATAKEAAHCWQAHVKPWLLGLPNLQVVVPIGVPAIQGLLGSGAGQLWAGGTYRLEELP